MDINLGKIIRDIRKDKDWTLDRMAKYLGIAKGTLSMIENEKSDPRNKSELLSKLNDLGYDFKVTGNPGDIITSIPLFESHLTVIKK